MGCKGCGKKKKTTRTLYSIPTNVKPRQTEGTNGYLEIAYVGVANSVRLRGCKTGKLYLFGRNIKRVIDLGDAECFLEKKSDEFEAYVEDVKSGDSKSELESSESTSRISEGDEQVHKDNAEELSGNH